MQYADGGLSLHRYFDNTETTGGDSAHFLAMNLTMDKQIAETLAVCDTRSLVTRRWAEAAVAFV